MLDNITRSTSSLHVGQQIDQNCKYMTIGISMLDNIFLLPLEVSQVVSISFCPLTIDVRYPNLLAGWIWMPKMYLKCPKACANNL